MRPYSGRKRRTNRRGALLLGGVLFTVLLIAGGAVYLHVRVVQKTVTSYAMGAPVSITLYGKDGAALEHALDDAALNTYSAGKIKKTV